MKTYRRIEKLSEAVLSLFKIFEKPMVVADVGTDHGYLAESLSKSSKIQKIIATDISEKSLGKLKKLIKKASLEKIETFVGDGLEPVQKADVSIIAGIGGWEIIKILTTQNRQDNKVKNSTTKCDYFVLQPAQNVNELRLWLFDNKIKILKDYIIYDADRFYPVIIVDVSKKQRNKKSIYNIWLGRDNTLDSEDFILYLKELKSTFVYLKDLPKSRIKKDKILRQKYKLSRIIEKLLNM